MPLSMAQSGKQFAWNLAPGGELPGTGEKGLILILGGDIMVAVLEVYAN